MFKSIPFGVLVVTVALVASACSIASGEIDGPPLKFGSANFRASALLSHFA